MTARSDLSSIQRLREPGESLLRCRPIIPILPKQRLDARGERERLVDRGSVPGR